MDQGRFFFPGTAPFVFVVNEDDFEDEEREGARPASDRTEKLINADGRSQRRGDIIPDDDDDDSPVEEAVGSQDSGGPQPPAIGDEEYNWLLKDLDFSHHEIIDVTDIVNEHDGNKEEEDGVDATRVPRLNLPQSHAQGSREGSARESTRAQYSSAFDDDDDDGGSSARSDEDIPEVIVAEEEEVHTEEEVASSSNDAAASESSDADPATPTKGDARVLEATPPQRVSSPKAPPPSDRKNNNTTIGNKNDSSMETKWLDMLSAMETEHRGQLQAQMEVHKAELYRFQQELKGEMNKYLEELNHVASGLSPHKQQQQQHGHHDHQREQQHGHQDHLQHHQREQQRERSSSMTNSVTSLGSNDNEDAQSQDAGSERLFGDAPMTSRSAEREKNARHLADIKAYYEHELEELRHQLVTCRQMTSRSHTPLRKLEEAHQRLQLDWEEKVMEVTRARAEAARLKEEIARALAEKESYEDRTIKTERMVIGLKNYAAQKDAAYHELERKYAILEDSLKDLCQQQERAADNLRRDKHLQSSLERDNEVLLQKIEAKSRDLAAYEAKLLDLRMENTELKRVMSKLELEVRRLSHELNAMRRRSDSSVTVRHSWDETNLNKATGPKLLKEDIYSRLERNDASRSAVGQRSSALGGSLDASVESGELERDNYAERKTPTSHSPLQRQTPRSPSVRSPQRRHSWMQQQPLPSDARLSSFLSPRRELFDQQPRPVVEPKSMGPLVGRTQTPPDHEEPPKMEPRSPFSRSPSKQDSLEVDMESQRRSQEREQSPPPPSRSPRKSSSSSSSRTTSESLTERLTQIDDLEVRMDELHVKKRRLEAELSRIPVRRCLNDQTREERIEKELNDVENELASIRLALKRLNILQSNIDA